jgi:hypothetical protein
MVCILTRESFAVRNLLQKAKLAEV